MKNLIKIIAGVLILSGTLMLTQSCKQTPVVNAPYKALIITGQNNHNWQSSSPILKQILENSGLFTADIAQSPAQGEDMSDFSPAFADYHLVVLDYNGDEWSAETCTAFEEYVSGGGGVVVYHAADNAFRNWKEYNEMIGLGVGATGTRLMVHTFGGAMVRSSKIPLADEEDHMEHNMLSGLRLASLNIQS